MARTISNTDKTLDSRDVIKRLDDLRAERDMLCEELGVDLDILDAALRDLAEENDHDVSELDEYVALAKFVEECEAVCWDWHHGATLIHESYWIKYVQELLEEMGMLPNAHDNIIVIDWEATARNLKPDYSTVTWDGETYYVRD